MKIRTVLAPLAAAAGVRFVRRFLAASGVIALAVPVAVASPAHAATVRSDTQNRLPYNLYFADINGDGKADMLQVGANKIFAFNADYPGTPILHKYLGQNVRRLLAGHFAVSGWEHSRDDVCAILADNSISCYAIDSSGSTLNWWFSQGGFIADDEQALVGDFDGNGNDDILVYKPSTGAVRMYEREVNGAFYFQPMPNLALSNLAGRINWRFYVGEFGQASTRADLLLVNPANGQVERYDSATDPNTGQRQFWWAFTTTAGVVGSNEDVDVARIANSSHDDVVLRDRTTGAVRFKQAEWAAGDVLASLTGVNPGGIARAASGQLVFAKMALWPGEPGGTARDDVLFFDYTSGVMYRWDARWDGTTYTYWWAYQKAHPALNSGWNGVTKDQWTIVMCTIKGQTATLGQNAAWWQQMFDPDTAGSLGAFYWDMSYGSLDLSAPLVYGTYQIPYTLSQLQNRGGDTRTVAWNECKTQALNAGKSIPGKMIAYVNVSLYGGFPGGITVTDNIGPGYLPALSTSALSHEMGHGYGLNENMNDSGTWYGDSWDTMSCSACTTTSGVNGNSGPGFDAGNRYALNFLPAGEVRLLTPAGSRQTVTVDVAALDRPDAMATANGAGLTVRIPIPDGTPVPECTSGNTCSTAGQNYTVELRQPRGFDAGFSSGAVFVHKEITDNGSWQSVLKGWPNSALSAGQTYADGRITVKVNSIDAARSVANVTITY